MTIDRFSVAIRVVKAFSIRECPSDIDVELLRAYYPNHTSLELDELARMVIEESIRSKKIAKTMAAGAEEPRV